MEFDSSQPIYLQIVRHFKIQIASGKLGPTDRIPSVRDISVEFSVNPNTVQKALATLEQEGLMYAERTSGRYITENAETIQKLKQSLFQDKTTEYIDFVEQLGYRANRIAELINQIISEGQ